jgi:hypothetical protein
MMLLSLVRNRDAGNGSPRPLGSSILRNNRNLKIKQVLFLSGAISYDAISKA